MEESTSNDSGARQPSGDDDPTAAGPPGTSSVMRSGDGAVVEPFRSEGAGAKPGGDDDEGGTADPHSSVPGTATTASLADNGAKDAEKAGGAEASSASKSAAASRSAGRLSTDDDKDNRSALPEGDDGGFGLGFGAAMAAITEQDMLKRTDSVDSTVVGTKKERKPSKDDRRQSRRDSVNARASMSQRHRERRDSVGRILGPESGRRVSISLKKRLQAVMGVPTASISAEGTTDDTSDGDGKHGKHSDAGMADRSEGGRNAADESANDMENGNDNVSDPSTSTRTSRRGSDAGMDGSVGSKRSGAGSVDGDRDDRTSIASGDDDDRMGFQEPYSGRKQVMIKKRESQTPSMFDQAAGKVYENLQELKERLDYRQSVIMPDSIFLLYWRKAVMFALIYCVIGVPYQVVFEDQTDEIEWGGYVTIGDILVCAMLSADIVLNFYTAYETKENVVVCKRQHIALNYANSWLLLDVCTTLPLDIIFRSVTTPTVGRYLRLVTLLRIARLTKMLHKNMKGKQITSIRRLVNVLFLTLCLCHYNACFWYFISTDGTTRYGRSTMGTSLKRIISPAHDERTWACTRTLQRCAALCARTIPNPQFTLTDIIPRNRNQTR